MHTRQDIARTHFGGLYPKRNLLREAEAFVQERLPPSDADGRDPTSDEILIRPAGGVRRKRSATRNPANRRVVLRFGRLRHAKRRKAEAAPELAGKTRVRGMRTVATERRVPC